MCDTISFCNNGEEVERLHGLPDYISLSKNKIVEITNLLVSTVAKKLARLFELGKQPP